MRSFVVPYSLRRSRSKGTQAWNHVRARRIVGLQGKLSTGLLGMYWCANMYMWVLDNTTWTASWLLLTKAGWGGHLRTVLNQHWSANYCLSRSVCRYDYHVWTSSKAWAVQYRLNLWETTTNGFWKLQEATIWLRRASTGIMHSSQVKIVPNTNTTPLLHLYMVGR